MTVDHDSLNQGDIVTLCDEPDAIIPAGTYRVSSVNGDGSFHVGGNTAVWPRRVMQRIAQHELQRVSPLTGVAEAVERLGHHLSRLS